MKFLLVTGLILFGLQCKAQDKFIGKSFRFIDESMKTQATKVSALDFTKDKKQQYITYDWGDVISYTFYYNSNESICIGFIETEKKVLLIEVIKNLNNEYTKIDNNNWVSKDNNYRAHLEIFDEVITVTHIKL